MTLHSYSLEEQTFGTKMGTSEKFQSTYNSKQLKKQNPFRDLPVAVVEMYRLPFQNCL